MLKHINKINTFFIITMKRGFLTSILLLSSIWATLWASQIADNHVYRIVNAGYGHAMTAAGAGNVTATEIDDSNDAQLWLAIASSDGSGYYMRNYRTGYYLTSSRARSATWQAEFSITPDDNKVLMKFTPTGENYFINTVNATGQTTDEGTHGYAHEDAARKVVGWNTNSINTQWTLQDQTAITAADIAAKKATWLSSVSEIIPGKAYRIRNYHYGHAMAPGNGTSLVGAQANADDSNQIWLVETTPEGDGYFIRNYETGKVVTSPCTREQAWSLQDVYIPERKGTAMFFNKKTAGFGISTLSTRDQYAENNNYTYAHENNQSKVLGYVVNSNPSLWHFTEVADITPADIAAKRQTWSCYKKYNIDSALSAIFVDAACTVLTPAYATKTVAELDTDPNVLALPAGLRPMVRKALTDDWSETDPFNGNQWDSVHARKFRVMMAEPFSESGGASSLAGVQAHGDVNNPTGIVTDNGTTLYIMLDEEPASGCEFRIAGRTGEGTPLATLNNTSDGVLLHKGLNILNCDKDLADMIIYYIVRTNNRQRAVTDYKPIKVHFEGGSLNGYFNYEGDELYSPDTNEDWLYYRERARHAMFCLLSKYNTLYIHLNDLEDGTKCLKSLCSPQEYAAGKFDLRATMKSWDELYLAEAMIMGWLPDEVIEAEKAAGRDYYDPIAGDRTARNDWYKYLNNRHLGISLRECGFMNATWWRTAYNPGTISSIIREFPTGDMWGPAHEMGHLNQGPMCIAGTTEESNNVFSNVALFYRGTHTSRADYPSVQRNRFNQGQNFHQHDTWGTTRMWFQLWLYYHAAGHDKRFYPRLYELLRKNPLRRTVAPGHEGETNPMLAKDDLLQFARMACQAAGEDLTDFFESWGFFVEQNGYFIGDYTSYTSYLSKEDIAAWKAEIAAMAKENGWIKNRAILFIDDRVGSTKQSYAFDNKRCGSMGGLKDFTAGAPVSGNYSYTLSGNTIQITGGTGGVGFMIHDKDGKLIGFANEPVFDISDAAAHTVRAGEAVVTVVDHANVMTVVTDAVHDGSLEQRLQAMDVLLEKSASMLAKSDREGRKAGFLLPELVAGLQNVYDVVKAKRDAGEITDANNVALYDSLYAEFMAVRNIEATASNTIPVRAGGIYVFTSNMQHTGKGITANAQGTQLANVNTGSVNMEDQAQQWVFEPADEEGYYYIRNVKFNKYIGKAAADKAIVAMQEEPMKQLVVFRELGGFSISPLGSDHDSFHDDGYGRLTRWDSSSKASRWSLTLIDNWEYEGALSDLDRITEKSEEIITRAGTVTETESGVVVTLNPEYNFVTEEMLVNLYNLVKRARNWGILKSVPTTDEIKALVVELEEAYAVLEEAMARNKTRLEELMTSTRELIDAIGEAQDSTVPVGLTAANLYSNAIHKESGSDKFSSWNVLLDNNTNTYFHSTYSKSNTPDGLDHYIRIELPEAAAEGEEYVFSYVTRKGNDYLWLPVDATLACSSDSVEWQILNRYDDDLAIGSAVTFETAPFPLPAGTKYLRLMVHKNRRSVSNEATDVAGGHCYFVLSEIGLARYNVASTPNTEWYPKANSQVMNEAMKGVYIGEQALRRPDVRNRRYDAAYENLLPLYEKLKAIYEDPDRTVGIEETATSTESAEDVIYTIDGIRVKSISHPGLYIVNGHKKMVR